MKKGWWVFGLMCLGILALENGIAQGQPVGSIVGWGTMVVIEPEALEDLVAVAGGGCHNLGLKSDGTIVAWGWNGSGECNVPSPNADFIAVAGGGNHIGGVEVSSTCLR